ncbi:U3 small nucleolar RNA-associated protein 20 [Kwoniella heveanensis BCC8398]|uniref:U3 small nucleolar RNA-associated protein 20 n=1 Tax=Kwoniella heveanensis BCC8398 TaxID=1296120 RepID=A0A1B9GIN1_9TREE|nr:U3 small nucleolar RNA-associated protein 20 [Kwoniella heveanensis BCC8398]
MAEPPQKRFRYATYNEQLKNLSVDVGKKRGLGWHKEEYDEDTEQSSTPLTAELDRLSLLDLTIPYQDLQRDLIPLSRTLPMTLHNLSSIQQLFFDFYSNLQEGQEHIHSGLDSALFLHQALYETCLGESLQYIPDTVKHLTRVGALRALEPKLVERTYSTLSLILRTIASYLLRSEPILRKTWHELRPYLTPRENKRYVRKCVADAWVGVIRKARSDGLTRLMDVLLENETEGMEAVWAHSLKGTSGQLHSRALAIYGSLLDRLVAEPTPHRVTTLGLVSTALVHHCSSSVIKPVIELVIAGIRPEESNKPSSSKISSTTTLSLPSSTAVLHILSTILLTRKGKRFPEALLKPLMQKLQSLIPHLSSDASVVSDGLSDEDRSVRDGWRSALVTCIVGCLQAGQLAHWLSPGVSLIEKLWEALDDRECFAFVNALVALKWPGIEQFLLSHIAKSSLPSLSADPLSTLVLLNNLASAGYLSGGLANVQGGRWRQALISALTSLLSQLQEAGLSEIHDRRILGQVMNLIPSLPSDAEQFAPHIATLVKLELDRSKSEDAALLKQGWEAGGTWNATHVLGVLLKTAEHMMISPRETVEQHFRELFVREGHLGEISKKWSWNREILSAISPLIDRWASDLSLSENHILQLLLPNLLSADSDLRLHTAQILSAVSSKDTPAGAEDHVPSPSGIWSLCVQVESSEMTLRNVRERTTNISRLSRAISSLPSTFTAQNSDLLRGLITYLIAQLKVNFRPVYQETIIALTVVAEKQGEVVWEIVWEELQKTNAAPSATMVDLDFSKPSWANKTRGGEDSASATVDEEEAEFRCPNLERSMKAIARLWTQASQDEKLDQQEIAPQLPKDRLDVLNYEAQLLGTLAAVPSIAEKHSRAIVPVFFTIARQSESDDEEVRSTHLSTKQLQARTASYLELLAKFVNPKAAFRTEDLHTLYLDILSKGEPKLQSLALKCLMTYKSPKLVPYQDTLETLLEDSKFRDELARLRLAQSTSDYGLQTQDKSAPAKTRVVFIDPSHREEALPIIIRLLYGIITSRRGRSSTAQGQTARKQAVLTTLSGCSAGELSTLIDLMLEPFGTDMEDIHVAGRQQIGYLTLLTDVLRYLGPQIVPHWSRLVSTTIALVANAQKRLTHANAETENAQDGEDGIDEEQDLGGEADKGLAPLRNIRSMGLKRLVQFFRSSVSFDFSPYLPHIFSLIISPRLDRLEVENTQAPSGTLDLIATIAASPETARSLVQQDDRTLPKAFACMTAVKVKPAVILRVFDIIDSLLTEDEGSLTQDVLLPHIRVLLDNIIGLVVSLKASANEDITRRLLAILSRLSVVVTDGQQAQQLASLLAPMLRQRQTTEKAKSNILATLQRLYAISPEFGDSTSPFFVHNYELISNLFQTLFFPSSRRALVITLDTFAAVDQSLERSIKLVGELNAYSARRIDEPDFDRRLAAYAELTDAAEEGLPTTTQAWLPILRSSLFYLHEPEELSIRTSASSVLQRFISLVPSSEDESFVETLQHVIIPGLKKTLRSKQELVRNEAIHVIAHAVKSCPKVPELAELQPLLAEGDDEASFFTNITHIQVHRRARALLRLRTTVLENPIRESTLSTIFLPILEHIVAGATEVSDHHLINEAIQTIGGLAGQLRWSRYYGLIGRYMKLGSVKSPQQKVYTRVISSIIDNFHFDLGLPSTAADESMDVDERKYIVQDGDDNEEDDIEVEAVQAFTTTSPERITEVILQKLLPSLSKFVATKDETESTIRIPLALAVVKLAHALPRASSENEVLRVITTVSQILRSKDQDTRDIARDTVCKIAVYLGPDWLVKVIRELETALTRGPQKHVLAVTTHAILVQATSQAADRFGDLDDAVELAVQVSAEVIWGESGKDVANEGFKTQMREVRGANSRGFDTFQLLSQLASPTKISTILSPLREVMHSSQGVKPMQQVDEALRRISLGLNSNSRLAPQDILSLCYSLISGNSSYLKPKRKAAKNTETPDSFKVQMKRDAKGDEDFYPQNAHKFAVFGLDLFVTAFRRGKFDFDDVSILSRLGPMVNAIGNTLYSPASNVLTLALKASAAVVRCPVPQVEAALPVFVNNIFKIIKHAGGTAEGEVAQTALKTLAVILRDCKTSQVTENQLRFLLEVIGPDLEEPDRQSAIFTILRSIIARKFVVPEIYDLMERVSSIMVTSQSSQVQELCRGAVMAFLLDYPQGKGRLKNQMTFFARNLEYTYEAGRISVMEVLNTVFTKFSDELVEEYADMFFVALVVVLANDESEKCRAAAGELIKLLWRRINDSRRSKMIEVLKSWVGQRENNTVLASAALGVIGLLIDTREGHMVEDVVKAVAPIIEESAEELQEAEESDEFVSLDHALPHQALSATAKAVLQSAGSTTSLPWQSIIAHLLFPHAWVRYDAARLLANLLSFDVDVASKVLSRDDLLGVARKGCLVLGGSKGVDGETVFVDGKLADEIVKVLYNVAKIWADSPSSNGDTGAQVSNENGNASAESDDETDADDDAEGAAEEERAQKNPLSWLMSRLSFLARHLLVHRPAQHTPQASEKWSAPILSILRFFAGVYEHLSKEEGRTYLVHILSPVYRILDEGGDLANTEDSQIVQQLTARPETADDLRTLATQVREFVQTKAGSSAFSSTWEKLRRSTVSRREERRDQRNKMVFTDPKKWAARKGRKVERGKEGKKRRMKAFHEGKAKGSSNMRRRR